MANVVVDFLKDLGLQIIVRKDSVGIQIGGNQTPLAKKVAEELPATDDSDLMNDDLNDDTHPGGHVIDIPRCTQQGK